MAVGVDRPGEQKTVPGCRPTTQRIDIAELNVTYATTAIRASSRLASILDGVMSSVGERVVTSFGISGARLVLTMMIELEQSQRRVGLGTFLFLVSERTT
jgi:hypothetical protein